MITSDRNSSVLYDVAGLWAHLWWTHIFRVKFHKSCYHHFICLFVFYSRSSVWVTSLDAFKNTRRPFCLAKTHNGRWSGWRKKKILLMNEVYVCIVRITRARKRFLSNTKRVLISLQLINLSAVHAVLVATCSKSLHFLWAYAVFQSAFSSNLKSASNAKNNLFSCTCAINRTCFDFHVSSIENPGKLQLEFAFKCSLFGRSWNCFQTFPSRADNRTFYWLVSMNENSVRPHKTRKTYERRDRSCTSDHAVTFNVFFYWM